MPNDKNEHVVFDTSTGWDKYCFYMSQTIKPSFIAALFVFTLMLNSTLKADVVILQSGTIVTGKILQQDDEGVLIQMDYGTFRYPPSYIKNVRKEGAEQDTNSLAAQRIPNWATIMSRLTTNGWAHGLTQIPATVIDNGVLQDVPYISFRCNSGGYEINIYGDLDNPAGVEIGAINYLKKNSEAKTNCVNFICSLLAIDDDRKVVCALNWEPKDLQKTNGMTFEITLPSEPDSYGGWWVGVNALAVSGTNLYVGGSFQTASGSPANNVAKWDGSAWVALGSGVGNYNVYSLAVLGTNLYVGGFFTTAGGSPAASNFSGSKSIEHRTSPPEILAVIISSHQWQESAKRRHEIYDL